MRARWLLLAALLGAAHAGELTAQEYNSMPRLFHLDDFEECGARRGVYCLGSFDLLPHTNDKLLKTIQDFSADKYHFNHTRIHRGYCVSSRCAHVPAASARARFQRCVGNLTRSEYGLESNLTSLAYCRGARVSSPPPDGLDLAAAGVAAALLLANLLGTAYDLLRDADSKPIKYLAAWSLAAGWARLTARHAGDARLAALRPVQGVKSLTLLLIMLAHTVLAYHITYINNPLFFEKAAHHPLSAYFQNGTSIVQTFVLASNFLLAYNLLLQTDGGGRPLGLRDLPRCLVHRAIRILPAYLVVVGAAATWWVRAADGPLWEPLVGGECSRCRDKWWAQLLFINNLVRPDVKCLIHTWFLAVDMQLYVVSCALTLALAAAPRRALWVLPALLALAVSGNFAAAYYFQLKPMVMLMFPEYMRTQFEQEDSFKWLYQAPWDSLPAALIGVFTAFLHHRLQQAAAQPRDSLIFRMVYRLSVPSMFLWVFLGYFMKGVTQPWAAAAYAALDRPVFVALTATAMFGFFNQVDNLWWRFLSWRGWEVLGRMSLSVYLVHWLLALTTLALRHHLSPLSVPEIGGQFLWTVFVSYWAALALHLLVEVPAQRCLQALLS